MAAHDKHSPQQLAEEFVISQALSEDPEQVLQVLSDIVSRMKAQGRYSSDEIDAAAAQLCRELGITRRVN